MDNEVFPPKAGLASGSGVTLHSQAPYQEIEGWINPLKMEIMRHSSFALWLFPLVFPLVLVCSPTSMISTGPEDLGNLGEGMKVLFIGNSLTQFNNLPQMVQVVGEAAGHEIAVRSVTQGNFSLEDHWLDGNALEAIQAADWDVVVLQQGPSSLAMNQLQLRESTKQFDEVIRAQGARTALYMVWPEATRPAVFDAVSEGYTKAAQAVDGILFPVGEAWRAAWRRDPTLDLYGSDGFHPSDLASALGALVMFQQLFDESPVGLPSLMVPTTRGLPSLNLPPHLTTLLQEAAAEANAEFGIR
jgi:hypothetical protein